MLDFAYAAQQRRQRLALSMGRRGLCIKNAEIFVWFHMFPFWLLSLGHVARTLCQKPWAKPHRAFNFHKPRGFLACTSCICPRHLEFYVPLSKHDICGIVIRQWESKHHGHILKSLRIFMKMDSWTSPEEKPSLPPFADPLFHLGLLPAWTAWPRAAAWDFNHVMYSCLLYQ